MNSTPYKTFRRALHFVCKLDQSEVGFCGRSCRMFLKDRRQVMVGTNIDVRRFLLGGKVGFIVSRKRTKREYVHGHIYSQWTNFGYVILAEETTLDTSTWYESVCSESQCPSEAVFATEFGPICMIKIHPLAKQLSNRGVFLKIWPVAILDNEPSEPI